MSYWVCIISSFENSADPDQPGQLTWICTVFHIASALMWINMIFERKEAYKEHQYHNEPASDKANILTTCAQSEYNDPNVFVKFDSLLFLLCRDSSLPALNQYLARINVSCSRKQRSEAVEARTRKPLGLESSTLPLSHCSPWKKSHY